MPATTRGIYHNLKESEYTASNSDVVLFFSSKLYLLKFLDGYREHREKVRKKMTHVAPKNSLNHDAFADLQFYRIVEKRGYRAWLKGVDVSWQDLEKYALRRMTEPTTLDWQRIRKPKLGERLKIMG